MTEVYISDIKDGEVFLNYVSMNSKVMRFLYIDGDDVYRICQIHRSICDDYYEYIKTRKYCPKDWLGRIATSYHGVSFRLTEEEITSLKMDFI